MGLDGILAVVHHMAKKDIKTCLENKKQETLLCALFNILKSVLFSHVNQRCFLNDFLWLLPQD